MWLFTIDPKINHHQIVPIKYNINFFQANVGHVFSEQETCDPAISTAGANF